MESIGYHDFADTYSMFSADWIETVFAQTVDHVQCMGVRQTVIHLHYFQIHCVIVTS